MMAVSPFFFTHYGTEPPWGWNKNWVCEWPFAFPLASPRGPIPDQRILRTLFNSDASDEALYSTRWEQTIKSKPDFVQIISWNDFGECHCKFGLGIRSVPCCCLVRVSALISSRLFRLTLGRHRTDRVGSAWFERLDGRYEPRGPPQPDSSFLEAIQRYQGCRGAFISFA